MLSTYSVDFSVAGRYDAKRQAKMRTALERVADTENISKGLRENVTKALR